jgi:hypothetical protein
MTSRRLHTKTRRHENTKKNAVLVHDEAPLVEEVLFVVSWLRGFVPRRWNERAAGSL